MPTRTIMSKLKCWIFRKIIDFRENLMGTLRGRLLIKGICFPFLYIRQVLTTLLSQEREK